MEPHPKLRKTIKWTGAAITVLLVAAWVVSQIRFIGFVSGRCNADINGGQFSVEYFTGPSQTTTTQFVIGKRVPPVTPHWLPDALFFAQRWRVEVPLELPIGLLALVTVAAWRLDTRARRRARLSLCPKCHYDRAGLAATAACPECGATPT